MWLSLRRMVSITITTIINPIFMSIIIINKKMIFQSDRSVEQRAQKVHQGSSSGVPNLAMCAR
jgi:hypothetical protein